MTVKTRGRVDNGTPENEELSKIFDRLRKRVLVRMEEDPPHTEPLPAEIDEMLLVVDVLKKHGRDPHVFLAFWSKLLMTVVGMSLPKEQADALLADVIAISENNITAD